MGMSDGAFLIIKQTPLPNGNHPILSPVCPMGVADTLEHGPILSISKARKDLYELSVPLEITKY